MTTKIDVEKAQTSIAEVMESMREKDQLNNESELEGMTRDNMVTASVVIKRLQKSRDLISAEADVIEEIINEYQETLSTCYEVMEHLNDSIDLLIELEIKEGV
jgi:chromosome segregation ATPase